MLGSQLPYAPLTANWDDDYYEYDYRIHVRSASHGSITSDMDYASRGDSVTLTVRPDWDYELNDITVTNDDTGRSVSVDAHAPAVVNRFPQGGNGGVARDGDGLQLVIDHGTAAHAPSPEPLSRKLHGLRQPHQQFPA